MGISVVTGANRGIGLALCQALKARGAHVVAACRVASPALKELGVEIVAGVEVSEEQGAQTLQRAVGEREIDLLINNAGILVSDDSLASPNYEGMVRQFAVNAMGPIRITDALRRNFKTGSRLAFITSRMGSVADNTSGGYYGYRMSKAALNVAAVSVARDLHSQGVAVVILHPGMVSTEMIGGRGQIEPETAAAGLLARIDDLTLESSGKFFHQNGDELPW